MFGYCQFLSPMECSICASGQSYRSIWKNDICC